MIEESIDINQNNEELGAILCCWPGCNLVGKFKAPVSRIDLKQFYWFCIEHIRAYNSNWNYCEGMSEAEFEASVRSDTTWNRPTWPFTAKAKDGESFTAEFRNLNDVFDPFNIIDGKSPAFNQFQNQFSETENRAIRVLGLEFPVSKDEVKARYKFLAKNHHPDKHGGDKNAEEMLKQINEAYEIILKLCVE